MRKIKDILRLKLEARLSHKRIAAALDRSKGVVTKYVGLAASAGLDWPSIALLADYPELVPRGHDADAVVT